MDGKNIESAEKTPKQGVKKNVKDSVFCDLFEDSGYLLQLYQALHPEDTETTADDLVAVTLNNVLVDQMFNDLGFIVSGRHPKSVILLEAQSSWTMNILIRIVMYLGETWNQYITSHNLNKYGSKKMDMPKPELYMIFTGERVHRPEQISLAKEFFDGDDSFMDVKVKIIYDGKKGDIINQYVAFTKVYTEQLELHGKTRKAVMETIRICKDKGVLKEYLANREKEVVTIMMNLFDQEYAMKCYGEEKKQEGEMKKSQGDGL